VLLNKKEIRSMIRRIALTAVFMSGGGMSAAEIDTKIITKTIVNFGAKSEPWRNVDDSVMGGVSSSRMRVEDNAAVFEGELSLENNGGFASVRSDLLEQDLEGFQGVRLRVKGDGQKYQLRIRVGQALDGARHQMTFKTKKDEWMEVDLPFSNFFAAYRGRQLPDHPPIDAAKITTMGLLIADKQEGNFRLEIDWLQGYRVVGATESSEVSNEVRGD
jgi:NADH dehydrogenase [ubiquinone] 1 alpha subcomplex assembly factor 1